MNSTVSPDDVPARENPGVVSLVRLSESDVPVSEAETRSGAAGAAGATRSTVSVVGELT